MSYLDGAIFSSSGRGEAVVVRWEKQESTVLESARARSPAKPTHPETLGRPFLHAWDLKTRILFLPYGFLYTREHSAIERYSSENGGGGPLGLAEIGKLNQKSDISAGP